MAAEQPNSDRSLKLDDVVRRFAETESMLAQAHQQLTTLLAAEQASDARAAALSEAAQAVESYSARAERLIDQGERSMGVAGEALEAGARLLDGSELAKLEAVITALREQLTSALAEQSRATQDELATINAAVTSLAATQAAQTQAVQDEQAKVNDSVASLREQLASIREEHAWLRSRRFLRI